MSFLAWLDDFIRPRSSKSSFDDSESLLEGNQEEHRIFTEEDRDIGEEPDEPEFLREDDSYYMSSNIVESAPRTNSTQPKTQQPPKRKLQESKESELDKRKISFLKTISQRMESRDKKTKNAEDRYAVTIADKLKELPYRERLMAKHEIENILFKYQMQVLEKGNSTQIQPNNNVAQNFPVFPFSMASESGQSYRTSSHQSGFINNYQQNQNFARNQSNQPLSPTYSAGAIPSPSFPRHKVVKKTTGTFNKSILVYFDVVSHVI